MEISNITSSEITEIPIVILTQQKDIGAICKEYLDPWEIPHIDVGVGILEYPPLVKKVPVHEMRRALREDIVPALASCNAQYVLVTDSEYFKLLANVAKVDANLGYVLDSFFGSFKVIYLPNHKAIFYDPDKVRTKIKLSIEALLSHVNGTYVPPGNEVIKIEYYPETLEEIKYWLDNLLSMKVPLAIDIEGFSLDFQECGIGSISFAWSKHAGVSFLVDYEPIPNATEAPYGRKVINEPVRQLLREFFTDYLHKAVYHNISFDVTVMIYQLFMKDILDTQGLLKGLRILLRNWDDTKLITYLATNSCAGNKLGLKDQAQEFAGNYAQDDIKDITKIKPQDLLKYNLVDSLSAWYVHGKHWPTLETDNQLDIYKDIFKPAIVDIIQMQLTGFPINIKRVKEVETLLKLDVSNILSIMASAPQVQHALDSIKNDWVIERNNTLKVKRVTVADCPLTFNPNSSLHLQKLLYDVLQLPVLDYTEKKQPATGRETIEKLKNHTTNPQVVAVLDALIDYSRNIKVLTTFIPAMLNARQGPDGWHYLTGNFNLGATVSGRLSSSEPNLQNLPASGKLGKLIKSCFQAPEGWLFVGIDFSSLEDRISALTTKDPNKLKVYTDGYDGHCLRAYSYFGSQMVGIDPNSVDSINSIADKYKDLRGLSKAPTFALTYQGTYITLMNNCGFTKELALSVEKSYHELYVHSDNWIQDKLDKATVDGYITAAFGLRVRTPLLKQVIRNNSKTPYEAQAEGRTAGNALGQSWCLLNNRAGSEFMGRVRNGKYRMDIRPCGQIHDAQYFLIKDNMETLLYTNKYVVKACEWQEHPDIAHDEVKLGGELSLFYPSWKDEMVIPNKANEETISQLLEKHIAKL